MAGLMVFFAVIGIAVVVVLCILGLFTLVVSVFKGV